MLQVQLEEFKKDYFKKSDLEVIDTGKGLPLSDHIYVCVLHLLIATNQKE